MGEEKIMSASRKQREFGSPTSGKLARRFEQQQQQEQREQQEETKSANTPKSASTPNKSGQFTSPKGARTPGSQGKSNSEQKDEKQSGEIPLVICSPKDRRPQKTSPKTTVVSQQSGDSKDAKDVKEEKLTFTLQVGKAVNEKTHTRMSSEGVVDCTFGQAFKHVETWVETFINEAISNNKKYTCEVRNLWGTKMTDGSIREGDGIQNVGLCIGKAYYFTYEQFGKSTTKQVATFRADFDPIKGQHFNIEITALLSQLAAVEQNKYILCFGNPETDKEVVLKSQFEERQKEQIQKGQEEQKDELNQVQQQQENNQKQVSDSKSELASIMSVIEKPIGSWLLLGFLSDATKKCLEEKAEISSDIVTSFKSHFDTAKDAIAKHKKQKCGYGSVEHVVKHFATLDNYKLLSHWGLWIKSQKQQQQQQQSETQEKKADAVSPS